MTIRLYDTARDAVVPFEPGSLVTIYTCGITPYDATHVGHAATYVLYDVLQRRLRDLGHETQCVRNITDVDDAILRKARELKVSYLDLAAFEVARFQSDMRALGMLAAFSEPAASSAIHDILGFIGMLIDRGHAYQAAGAVYFSVASFERFGQVSHLDRDEMLAFAAERGGNPDDPAKRDPLDFVLWQPSAPDEPAWDSLWGPGRPGWHIECSALALRELGTTIDLHGGGTDLIFPHHECETAQSESATGERFVRHWLHAPIVEYEGTKMSTSLGNLVFISELVKEWDPMAVRLAILDHSYRKPWTWHEALLDRATERLERWSEAGTGAEGTIVDEVRAALDNDLDVPRAIRAIDDAAAAGQGVRRAAELIGVALSPTTEPRRRDPMTELEQLPAASLVVLQAAALLGSAFDKALLEQLSLFSGASVHFSRTLAHARARGILKSVSTSHASGGDRYEFNNSVHHAVLSTISVELRDAVRSNLRDLMADIAATHGPAGTVALGLSERLPSDDFRETVALAQRLAESAVDPHLAIRHFSIAVQLATAVRISELTPAPYRLDMLADALQSMPFLGPSDVVVPSDWAVPEAMAVLALVSGTADDVRQELSLIQNVDVPRHAALMDRLPCLESLAENTITSATWRGLQWIGSLLLETSLAGTQVSDGSARQRVAEAVADISSNQLVDAEAQASLDRAASESARQKGEKLERSFLRLLRRLFDIPDEPSKAVISRLRQQRPGLQFGHDIEFDCKVAGTAVRCHVECKYYKSPLSIQDIAAKLAQAQLVWNTTRIDHWILVSPLSDPTNELGLYLDWARQSNHYSFTVQVWSPESGVDQLFALDEDVFAAVYGARGRPRVDGEAVRKVWLQRLRPALRLPTGWQDYVLRPDLLCVAGEEHHEYDRLWHEAVPLRARSESEYSASDPLLERVLAWLNVGPEPSFLLLGEFGDGKSFFTYLLARTLHETLINEPDEGWLVLRIGLREFRSTDSATELLQSCLSSVGLSHPDWQWARNNRRVLAILDGIDEMSISLDPRAVAANLDKLDDLIELLGDIKVLATSRTHFFETPRDQVRFNERLRDPIVFRIAPVQRAGVLAYLAHRAEASGSQAKLSRLRRLYDPIGMASKPLFLSMIAESFEVLPDERFDVGTLYETYVGQSLKRKVSLLSDDMRLVHRKEVVDNLLIILEDIAASMHFAGHSSVNLRQYKPSTESDLTRMLWRMASEEEEEEEREAPVAGGRREASRRIGMRSLLKPVQQSTSDEWRVDFFHRSMREYFVARALLRAIQERRLGGLLDNHILQPEVVYFVAELTKHTPAIEGDALETLARSIPAGGIGYRGGNALTLLYTTSGAVPSTDWSGLNLDGAQLIGADLNGRSFRGSTLRWARLDNVSLRDADLRNADLTGVRFEETTTVTALAWSAGRSVMYAAYTDGSVRRWKTGPGQHWESELIIEGLSLTANELLIGPQGQLVLTGSSLCEVYVEVQARYIRWASFPLPRDVGHVRLMEDDIGIVDGSALTMRARIASTGRDLGVQDSPRGVLLLGGDVVLVGGDDLRMVHRAGNVSPSLRPVGGVSACSGMVRQGPLSTLVALGDSEGTINVLESVDRLEWRLLYAVPACRAPVTAVELLSEDLVVVAGGDGSMSLIGLADSEFRCSLQLHIDTHGLQFDGVKSSIEYKKLRALSTETRRNTGDSD